MWLYPKCMDRSSHIIALVGDLRYFNAAQLRRPNRRANGPAGRGSRDGSWTPAQMEALPSGKRLQRLHNYGKITLLMGKLSISHVQRAMLQITGICRENEVFKACEDSGVMGDKPRQWFSWPLRHRSTRNPRHWSVPETAWITLIGQVQACTYII